MEKLGRGEFGVGYKISVSGAEDVVLKKFHKITRMAPGNSHGVGVEVQTGLFVNNHSNDFVKMYCGKIVGSEQSDGYLITQFLAENITPIENPNIKGGYHIISRDSDAKLDSYVETGHNVIAGKIIEFGDVEVTKSD